MGTSMEAHTAKILLIDKPAGITSFDVIRVLRRRLGPLKMGHAGTLDPFATGLLLVGVGDGTHQLKNLIGLPKTYDAEVLLGVSTTTGDPDGKVVEEKSVSELDLEAVKKEMARLVGVHSLPVPRYSAIKVAGTRLYKLAREGRSVALPVKTMEVRAVQILGTEHVGGHVILHLTLEVTSGTYIRSIAEELGKRLGYPASLRALRRTRVGSYRVEDAESLELQEYAAFRK